MFIILPSAVLTSILMDPVLLGEELIWRGYLQDKMTYIKSANKINEMISFEISQYITSKELSKLTQKQQFCVLYLDSAKKVIVGQLLKRLEKDSLVKREINPLDRKEIFVTLDEKGLEYTHRFNTIVNQVIEKYYDVLTLEEAKMIYEINMKILTHINSQK